MELAHEHV